MILRSAIAAKKLSLLYIVEDDFHIKTTMKATFEINNSQLLLVMCFSDNSPPFERSAFYVSISENFEHFQDFNFESDFLENENFVQKTGVSFFS